MWFGSSPRVNASGCDSSIATPDPFALFDALSLGLLACANGVAVVRDMVCREGESITRSPNNPSSILEHEHNNHDPTFTCFSVSSTIIRSSPASSNTILAGLCQTSIVSCHKCQATPRLFHVKHVQGQNTDQPWRAWLDKNTSSQHPQGTRSLHPKQFMSQNNFPYIKPHDLDVVTSCRVMYMHTALHVCTCSFPRALSLRLRRLRAEREIWICCWC